MNLALDLDDIASFFFAIITMQSGAPFSVPALLWLFVVGTVLFMVRYFLETFFKKKYIKILQKLKKKLLGNAKNKKDNI